MKEVILRTELKRVFHIRNIIPLLCADLWPVKQGEKNLFLIFFVKNRKSYKHEITYAFRTIEKAFI